MDALKKRLEEVKEKWVDKLSHVLWTYRTMPKRSMDETPFSMTYGSEAVIPKKQVPQLQGSTNPLVTTTSNSYP